MPNPDPREVEDRPLRVLDLFSGIGGFSLGLERAGMKTVAFCEISPKCRFLLNYHWPNVPCFEDVCTLKGADIGSVEVICGGFPCQDISEANIGGAGLDGERSGLWSEFCRLVSELQPRYVIVENTAALLWRGLGRVLGDLATVGYDAEWHCIPASAVGAPHERDRLWLIAYPATTVGRPILEHCHLAWANRLFAARPQDASRDARPPAPAWASPWREVVDDLRRLDDGLSARMDGFNGYANAVVPQIPEMIGRAILAARYPAVLIAAGK